MTHMLIGQAARRPNFDQESPCVLVNREEVLSRRCRENRRLMPEFINWGWRDPLDRIP